MESKALSCIYIMRCGGLFKIGVSTDPGRRLRQLQTGNAHSIRLLFCAKIKRPYQVERVIHQFLKEYPDTWVKGEWFRLPKACVLGLAKTILGYTHEEP